MTCIAVKGPTMACDSCWASEGIVNNMAKKIYRLETGALLGQAGDNDAREIVKLFQKVKTGRSMPSRAELLATRTDFSGLLLLPNGEMYQIASSHLHPEQIDTDVGIWKVEGFKYMAVGTGADIALGALYQGATPSQAVAAACRHQVDCRPPIHQMTIAKVKKNGR